MYRSDVRRSHLSPPEDPPSRSSPTICNGQRVPSTAARRPPQPVCLLSSPHAQGSHFGFLDTLFISDDDPEHRRRQDQRLVEELEALGEPRSEAAIGDALLAAYRLFDGVWCSEPRTPSAVETLKVAFAALGSVRRAKWSAAPPSSLSSLRSICPQRWCPACRWCWRSWHRTTSWRSSPTPAMRRAACCANCCTATTFCSSSAVPTSPTSVAYGGPTRVYLIACWPS